MSGAARVPKSLTPEGVSYIKPGGALEIGLRREKRAYTQAKCWVATVPITFTVDHARCEVQTVASGRASSPTLKDTF